MGYAIRNLFIHVADRVGSYAITGPVFGNMDNFTGLGVFVDTYPNEEKHLEVCRSKTPQNAYLFYVIFCISTCHQNMTEFFIKLHQKAIKDKNLTLQ